MEVGLCKLQKPGLTSATAPATRFLGELDLTPSGGLNSPMLFAPAVFSDSEEEALLKGYFSEKRGVFVDVGANDPSNAVSRFLWGEWSWARCRALARAGERFRTIPGLTVAEFALTSPENVSENGYARFSIAGKQSTLLPEKLMDRDIVSDTVNVRVTTLQRLLADQRLQAINFLSVDVEGAELDVLSDFDLKRFQVSLLLVEDWGRDFQLHDTS